MRRRRTASWVDEVMIHWPAPSKGVEKLGDLARNGYFRPV